MSFETDSKTFGVMFGKRVVGSSEAPRIITGDLSVAIEST